MDSEWDKYKLILQTFPSIVHDHNENGTQFDIRWEQFDKLPENIKNKMSAKKTSEVIQQIGKIFELDLSFLPAIARSVRNYYFGELKLEDMPAVLAKEIPIDLTKAQEISKMVVQKIINDNSVEETAQAKLVQMTVSDALKNYPEVGEQLITSEKIVLKNFPDPVRPCLKNWLADFTFTLGRDRHAAMDRGIYLFQSTNGKKLNSQDRNKLAFVLKAYDEGLQVTINKDTKQIIFSSQSTVDSSQDDKIQETRNNNQTISNNQFSISNKTPISNDQNSKITGQNMKTQGFSSDMHSTVRFSSAQKLPYEQKHPIKYPLKRDADNPQFNGASDQPYIIKPVVPEQKPQALPKNVVNLKDNS